MAPTTKPSPEPDRPRPGHDLPTPPRTPRRGEEKEGREGEDIIDPEPEPEPEPEVEPPPPPDPSTPYPKVDQIRMM